MIFTMITSDMFSFNYFTATITCDIHLKDYVAGAARKSVNVKNMR